MIRPTRTFRSSSGRCAPSRHQAESHPQALIIAHGCSEMTRVTLLPTSAIESADVSGIGCEIAVITWAGILIPEAGPRPPVSH